MKKNSARFLIILQCVINIAGCKSESPNQTNESSFNFSFNQNFYQKFLGTSTVIGYTSESPYIHDFCNDKNSFLDITTDGSFVLKICGHVRKDSDYVDFETSGTVEVLHKNYVPPHRWVSGYWEGELKIKIENNTPREKDFMLTFLGYDVTLEIDRDSLFLIDADDSTYFLVSRWYKNYYAFNCE